MGLQAICEAHGIHTHGPRPNTQNPRLRRRATIFSAALLPAGGDLAAAFGSPPAAMAKPLGTTGEFFKRRDEWRKHPMLTNQFRHALPGFGIAVVAFSIYLVGEAAYDKFYRPDHHPKSSASGSH